MLNKKLAYRSALIISLLLLISLVQIFFINNEFIYHTHLSTNDKQQNVTKTFEKVYSTDQQFLKGQSLYLNISSTENITFILNNKSFEDLSASYVRNIGWLNDSFNISYLGHEDIPFFLFKGDFLNINFSFDNFKYMPSDMADSGITFDISDSNGNVINQYLEGYGVNSIHFKSSEAQTYHLNWYDQYKWDQSGNPPSPINYHFWINYNISDFTVPKTGLIKINANNLTQINYTFTNNGNYSLMFSHNQMNGTASVTISYNENIETPIKTKTKEPTIFLPAAIILSLVFFLGSLAIIITAVYKTINPIRNTTSKIKKRFQSTKVQKKQETRTVNQVSNFRICPQCGYNFKKDDYFCSKCGIKVNNGAYIIPINHQLVKSTNCFKCNYQVDLNSVFCPNCGEKVH